MPSRIAATLAAALMLVAAQASSAFAQDPLRSAQWALDAIHLGASPSAAASRGEGVVVAVLDTGVDAGHPDLGGRILLGPDLVDGGRARNDPHGHGTHLAGVIAATAGNGIGGDGVAPAARILAIRVLDARNIGSSDALVGGINAAIGAGADVINLSLNWPVPAGTGIAGAKVDAAIERAANAGIAVIVAAGNRGLSSCEEPAQPGRTLCVGALDSELDLAGFSSHGTGLGVVAPGSRLVSTAPGGGYSVQTGTSQAAAMASGVAALLAARGLRGRAILQRLSATARDLGAAGYDPRFGFGLVDAQRALDGAAEGRIPPLLQVRSARKVRLSTVRRRGLRVSCDAARAGTCRVRVKARGVTIAKGRTRVEGTGPVKLTARTTKAGRRVLARRGGLNAQVTAALEGAPGARAHVALRR